MKKKIIHLIKKINYRSPLLYIFISFMFLSVGYSALNGASLLVLGSVNGDENQSVFIDNVRLIDSSNADTTYSNVAYSTNYVSDLVTLSETDLDSYVTYQVTVMNNSLRAVKFIGVTIEPMIELGINDNPLFTMVPSATEDGYVLDIGQTKKINLTFKYKDTVTEITDNDMRFALSFQYTEVCRITYVNFLGFNDLPKYVSVGESVVINFPNDNPEVRVVFNNNLLTEGNEYTVVNNVLTYHITELGNISITRITDYPIANEFDVTRAIPGDYFVFNDEIRKDTYQKTFYNGNQNTYYWEVDMTSYDPAVRTGNLISIGSDIYHFDVQANDAGVNGVNMHIYYPDETGQMVIAPMIKGVQNLQFRFPVELTDGNTIGKFAMNSNGLFFNGELVISGIKLSNKASVKQNNTGNNNPMIAAGNFFNALGTDHEDFLIGCVEGKNRSTFNYLALREFDKKLSITELIDITTISNHTEIRENINYTIVPCGGISANNQFSLGLVDIFLHNQTMYFEIDTSTMNNTGFENIISMGKEIDKVIPTTEGNANLHFYYNKDTRQLLVQPTFYGSPSKSLSITIPESQDLLKIVIGRNGLYVNSELICSMEGIGSRVSLYENNGDMAVDAYLYTFLHSALESVYSVEIGSKVGNVRSTAKYNAVKIYNEKMNQNELIYYTIPIVSSDIREYIPSTDISTKFYPNPGDITDFVFGSLDFLSDSINSNTIFAKIDISSVSSTTSDECLFSMGSDIAVWRNYTSTKCNIHLYYMKNGNYVIIDAVAPSGTTVSLRYNLPSGTKFVKLAYNINGLYINGDLIFNSNGSNPDTSIVSVRSGTPTSLYYGGIINIWANEGYTYKLGCMEGNPSTSTYTEVKIFNSLLTPEELIFYTGRDKLTTVEPGSYVTFVGNNGCTGESCSGRNANYNNPSEIGYCTERYHFYTSDGWRVAYFKEGYTYIVSGGATECVGSDESGNLSNNTGVTITHSNLNPFRNNLSQKAITYCNTDYSAGGVCDSSTAWYFNADDFEQTLKAFDSSSTETMNTCKGNIKPSCGQNNPIIDITGNYRINTISNGDLKTYYYTKNKNNGTISFGDYVQGGADGFRPVIKLDNTLFVLGGAGTRENPYIIGKN